MNADGSLKAGEGDQSVAKKKGKTAEKDTDGQTDKNTIFNRAHGEASVSSSQEQTDVVRSIASDLQDKFGVEVEVVDNLDGVVNNKARKAIAAGENIKGWYDLKTGKVVLYAPNIISEQEARATYAHEVVAHKGMRGLLGEERYNELCDKLGAQLTDEQRERIAEYNGESNEVLGDEYIARIAEELIDERGNIKEPSTWAKVKAAFRQFFRGWF